jgi:hypothetical protein
MMPAPIAAENDDDMDDSAEILEYGAHPELHRLVQVLTCVRDQIVPAFRVADSEVSRYRNSYMRFARWAAWLGALAVTFAIIQLSELFKMYLPPKLLPLMEFGLAAAAVTIAIVGLAERKQQKWFLARQRAEQLRHLKFNFLTRLDLWSSHEETAENCRQGLAAEVEAARATSFSSLEHWVTQGTVPRAIHAPSMSEAEWKGLKNYYRNKRLMGQVGYFREAAERNLQRNDRTRTWPSVLFFGSVAFVLTHFCIELARWSAGGDPDVLVGKVALVLAAALPVCGAGIRVIRGVLEYGRNASRYESTHNVLLALSERLREANDAETAFREIGFCEQALEAESREWVRLLIEAEWFG